MARLSFVFIKIYEHQDSLMRIKLRKGKQQELIEGVKEKYGYIWEEFAKELEISGNYLKNELRNEKRTLSSEMYEQLCSLLGEDYDAISRGSSLETGAKSKAVYCLLLRVRGSRKS